ncbi:23S rRNA pseudouridine(2604) synthase RluF [Pseudoflavitalea sp. G-6-1-2]|uniref:23S rRNA pseudouridine(2604) synthase RluF n=1 Tax=Pseudoflavitalea sp. G-6-1-2 TaxID=2728841 RepID=UPI0019800FF1|nr:23S rRNA pseudouridine(2604) synthase RluF [Pseudoflavitalea sp. G-6-1-2]
MDNSISLNKFISDTGYCSRREADNLITEGRVLLNDKPASLGNRYKPGDTVEVDGSLITAAKKEKRVYIALNKPIGITTTTELHIKDNIISFVGYPKRIFPIGRLDKDSEGLILLTNDGDIINKILRADNKHEKEYIVRVNKPIDHSFVQQMSQGVPILDTRTLPCKVQMMGRQTFRITLTQGLNRQIRRMCEYLGYAVVGLQRVRIMNIRLDKLAVGKWRYLSEAELSLLMEDIADSSQQKKPEKPANGAYKKAARKSTAPKPEFAPKDRTQTGSGKAAKPTFKKDDKPAAGNHKKTGNKSTGSKPDFSPKDKARAGYTKAAKPAFRKEDKAQAGKKPAGNWKKENSGQKSAPEKKPQHNRPEKNAGNNQKDNDQKKGRQKGSFKDYRSKGRR